MINMFSSKVILDSINKYGNRLTTLEVRYPRIIHSELMTHRAFSRNAASSRAIPVKKLLAQVLENPFIPEKFGINQKGMQATNFLEGDKHEEAVAKWLQARDYAYKIASELAFDLDVHKQLANRLLEPFSWITVIITATDWENFFYLRCNPAAQPEINKIANLMKESLNNSKPKLLNFEEWHTPYIQNDEPDLDLETAKRASVARSARISYLTHDNKRNIELDLGLFERLSGEGHMSPFEHVARPMEEDERKLTGNFNGWVQYRKLLSNENKTQLNYLGWINMEKEIKVEPTQEQKESRMQAELAYFRSMHDRLPEPSWWDKFTKSLMSLFQGNNKQESEQIKKEVQ